MNKTRSRHRINLLEQSTRNGSKFIQRPLDRSNDEWDHHGSVDRTVSVTNACKHVQTMKRPRSRICLERTDKKNLIPNRSNQ